MPFMSLSLMFPVQEGLVLRWITQPPFREYQGWTVSL